MSGNSCQRRINRLTGRTFSTLRSFQRESKHVRELSKKESRDLSTQQRCDIATNRERGTANRSTCGQNRIRCRTIVDYIGASALSTACRWEVNSLDTPRSSCPRWHDNLYGILVAKTKKGISFWSLARERKNSFAVLPHRALAALRPGIRNTCSRTPGLRRVQFGRNQKRL